MFDDNILMKIRNNFPDYLLAKGTETDFIFWLGWVLLGGELLLLLEGYLLDYTPTAECVTAT
jgi:hypothetical protein